MSRVLGDSALSNSITVSPLVDVTRGFMRVQRVADMLDRSISDIFQAVKDGRFPRPYKLSKKYSVFLRSEVEAWMLEQVHAARAAAEEVSNG